VEPVAPKTLLYDFLYRDPARVASYYAQLFGGHLTAQENTSQKRSMTENAFGGNAGVVKGDRKSVTEGAEGSKSVLSPHDTILCDLLIRLAEQGRVREAAAAPAGAIVRATGALALVDGSGLRAAIAGLTAAAAANQPQPNRAHRRGQGGPAPSAGPDLTSGLAGLSQMTFPSLFMLKTPEAMYYGTVKDAGLDEPVIGFLFKHGDQGLPGVTVLGVKEGAEPFPTFPEDGLLQPSRGIMGMVSRMMTPPGGVPLTPVVMYRGTGLPTPDTRP
jgi:hypothetical protein